MTTITLKKSFELQNYLRRLFYEAEQLLMDKDNMTTKVLNHYRSRVFAEAQDETEEVPKPSDMELTPTELIDFTLFLASEINSLTEAINRAKGYEYDTLIANNKTTQRVLACLEEDVRIRSTSRTYKGTAQKFNVDGNQVNYSYDIEEVQMIDFDRNNVKAIISRLRKEVSNTSQKIDKLALESIVNYDGDIFEIGESLDDAFNRVKPIMENKELWSCNRKIDG